MPPGQTPVHSEYRCTASVITKILLVGDEGESRGSMKEKPGIRGEQKELRDRGLYYSTVTGVILFT